MKGTKKDAERLLTKMKREHDLGVLVAPSTRTLADFMDEWLSTVKAMSVRPRTLDDYRFQADRYILPALGHLKLAQLTPNVIQKHYASLQPRLSSRSIRYAHSVLHGALEQALKWQLLAVNPAKAVELPRKAVREMSSLTVEHSHALLGAAEGTRFEALWFLLLTGGLRPGEALALTWTDLVEDRVRVQRSLSRRPNGEWNLDEPKTARARRVVSLPSTTVKKLQAHRTRQLEERLRAGPAWTDLNLVFSNATGGPLEWRTIARRYFAPLLERAGIPRIRPYDLRHSSATLLLSAHENVKVVSERLGHHSASLTLDTYAHVLPDMGAKAAEKLEKLLCSPVTAAHGG